MMRIPSPHLAWFVEYIRTREQLTTDRAIPKAGEADQDLIQQGRCLCKRTPKELDQRRRVRYGIQEVTLYGYLRVNHSRPFTATVDAIPPPPSSSSCLYTIVNTNPFDTDPQR